MPPYAHVLRLNGQRPEGLIAHVSSLCILRPILRLERPHTRKVGLPVSRLRSPGISGRLLISITLVYAFAAALMVHLVTVDIRAHAIDDAAKLAMVLAEGNEAIAVYFRTDLKPSVMSEFQDDMEEGYFDPAWMSSSSAVRQIDDIRDEISSDAYYYRRCSVGARNPVNEADEFEADFIARANADPNVTEWSGVRERDGVPYYAVLKTEQPLNEQCLGCHGTVSDAPSDMVALYGDERGFGYELGQVFGAYSILIPLADGYAQAEDMAHKLSAALLGILLVSYGVIFLVSRRMIVQPVLALRDEATALASGAATHETFAPQRAVGEIGELEDAFQSMSEQLSEQMDALTLKNQELHDALEAKSQFLANMSHELRTPLNSVIGFTGIVRGGLAGDINEEQERQLTMAQNSGRQLLQLIDDVLDIEKIEAGAVPIRVSEFELDDLLKSAAESTRPQADAKRLPIRVETGSCRIPVRSDAAKINQIILNLLSNAVKFTEEGEILIEVECDKKTAKITVVDTGLGIPPEEIERVFEEFHQVYNDLVGKPVGTGLGLAISRQYAEMLGGTLTAEAVFGSGSAFTLEIPRHIEIAVRPTE